MKKPHIAAVSIATPPFKITQTQSLEHLIKRYKDKLSPRSMALMQKIFAHPSIVHRYFAFDCPESLFDENQDSRIKRFTNWSVELSSQAILGALTQAGLTVNDVGGMVINTCTGYICPGISTYLIEKLGLSRKIGVYDLVGSGCGGAIPNLQISEALLDRNRDGVIISASVEICSATFQMEDDINLIISNALFGDGAAASVLWNRPEGFEMISSASMYAPEDREAIRYIHKNGRLYNQLATNLPRLVRKVVAQVVNEILKPLSLEVKDIKHWALHTGGEKIINNIKEEIGLSETQLQATRDILARYGNMSSPTIWFVLRDLMDRGIKKGDWCMMVAFGAGLSSHAYLLRKK